MRSPLTLFLIAILSTGVVHTLELATIRNLDEGDHLQMETIVMNDDTITRCYLETPNGDEIEFMPNDQSDDKYEKLPTYQFRPCRGQVNNVAESDTGTWILHADFGSTSYSQPYNLTVNPAPVTNDDKIVQYMTAQSFNTTLGNNHEVIFDQIDTSLHTNENCEVLTPAGRQFNIDNFHMTGVELFSDSRVACGIKLNVQNEDIVGQWVLISTILKYEQDRVERRLPFTIHVEEIVKAEVDDIYVSKGMDFYVRLRNPINDHETCKLIGPFRSEYESAEPDPRYPTTCGFVVRDAREDNNGQWQIVYGSRITYRAVFSVIFNNGAENSDASSNLILTLDRPADVQIGPEKAIYCRVEDPQGFIVSEGFGRCNVTVNRVTMEHQGVWKMSYGLQGRVLTVDEQFTVTVSEAAPKAVVTTSVVSNKPIVTLSCSVSSPHPIRACKFREPSGRVLIAAEGVGESRYTFHGTGVSYESGVHTHDCGIQITDPIVADLGLWRCAIETEGEDYYGFLSVLCPWALRDPEVAAQVITEPILTADRDTVTTVVGDTVSMSCSVQSAIRYCYFRARNGTVFNVGPGQSHDTAIYTGAGFDAGECSITFPTLGVRDTGAWSCHVGLVGLAGENRAEQRATVAVTVHDAMVAEQHMVGQQLFIEAQVHGQSRLEYCRYVRIDGLGFTGEQDNVPSGYHSIQNLATGKCGLVVEHPTMLDHHPWTLVARVKGQEEISRVTAHTIEMPPDSHPEAEVEIGTVYVRVPYVWIIIMSVGLLLILLALVVGPKKNRAWTRDRACRIRDSFRRSFMRKTIEQNDVQKSTAIAA